MLREQKGKLNLKQLITNCLQRMGKSAAATTAGDDASTSASASSSSRRSDGSGPGSGGGGGSAGASVSGSDGKRVESQLRQVFQYMVAGGYLKKADTLNASSQKVALKKRKLDERIEQHMEKQTKASLLSTASASAATASGSSGAGASTATTAAAKKKSKLSKTTAESKFELVGTADLAKAAAGDDDATGDGIAPNLHVCCTLCSLHAARCNLHRHPHRHRHCHAPVLTAACLSLGWLVGWLVGYRCIGRSHTNSFCSTQKNKPCLITFNAYVTPLHYTPCTALHYTILCALQGTLFTGCVVLLCSILFHCVV